MLDIDRNDTTRLVHLDAVGGIAGDMFVAALLDAFPALTERAMADVRAVLPPECGESVLEAGFSAGIQCLRFRLRAAGQSGVAVVKHPPHCDDDHEQRRHDGHNHGHARHPGPSEPAVQLHHGRGATGHHGARFADLKALIAAAPLAPGTAREAVAILAILAVAEAHIHGVDPDKLHFHEVGDWDSLMDVVAAGSIVAALGAIRWSISDLPRGSGLIRTQHGLLPVPAPATTEILKGFRWRDDGIGGERVTPTGAAIVRHLCNPAAAQAGSPGMLGRLVSTGTGAGTRETAGMPNILRATVFAPAACSRREDVELLAFDIDDMTGEEIAVAADRLRAFTGVIDLTLQTVVGKKGRPVCRFEIIVENGCLDAIAAKAFAETSTLGVRWRSERRMVLQRQQAQRGGLRVKIATRAGETTTTKVESDELAVIETLALRRAAAREAEAGRPRDD